MRDVRFYITPGLAAIGLLTNVGFADEHIVPAKPAAAQSPAASSTVDSKIAKERRLAPEEISTVYMNCLIEVDRTLAGLAKYAKHKVVKAEGESQRAFCANRKRDCQERPQSVECRTFVEEFSNVGLPNETPRKN